MPETVPEALKTLAADVRAVAVHSKRLRAGRLREIARELELIAAELEVPLADPTDLNPKPD